MSKPRNLSSFFPHFLLVAALAMAGCDGAEAAPKTTSQTPTSAERAPATSSSAERAPATSSSAERAPATSSSAERPPSVGMQALQRSAYELDPLDDLIPFSGAAPQWEAPSRREDGAPITLRAARSGNDVVIWGYGAPAGAAGLSFDARLADAGGIIRSTEHVGVPVTPAAGAWFYVGTLRGAAKLPKAQVQLGKVVTEAGGVVWQPPAAKSGWRRRLPKEPAQVVGEAKLGFTVIAAERVETPGERQTVLVAALHNGGSKPLSRVVLEVVPRDAKGPMGTLQAVWVPKFGDGAVPNVPRGGWSTVTLKVDGDVERVLAATHFDVSVKEVEHD